MSKSRTNRTSGSNRDAGKSADDAAASENSSALALPTITRGKSNQLLRARATELLQEAKSARQERIRAFEAEHGRTDRIDASLLQDMQRVQVRFAAIAARQQRHGQGQEPKANKLVDQLGEIVGRVTAFLATETALELFSPIDESEYLGYGGKIGSKGYDASVLEGYEVVDDPSGPAAPGPSALEDGEGVCLHENVEPYEDQPGLSVCTDCDAEFSMPLGDETAEAA